MPTFAIITAVANAYAAIITILVLAGVLVCGNIKEKPGRIFLAMPIINLADCAARALRALCTACTPTQGYPRFA